MPWDGKKVSGVPQRPRTDWDMAGKSNGGFVLGRCTVSFFLSAVIASQNPPILPLHTLKTFKPRKIPSLHANKGWTSTSLLACTVEPRYKNPRYKNTLIKTSSIRIRFPVLQG